jgi:hypothetical protein
MSKRTIAKILAFVIFAAVVASVGCGASKGQRNVEPNPNFLPPKIVGKISAKDIVENSGIAVSRCQGNVLWTHNDSGDDAYIFAIDTTGKLLATYLVQNAKNKDWEDIAAYKDSSGRCYVYIGEIGDNDLERDEHVVYRVPEPIVPTGGSQTEKKNALKTASAEALNFRYPDHDHNAETLMVHPVTGDVYVLSKERSLPSSVFRLKPVFNSPYVQTAEKIAEIMVPSIPNGFLTGGDISPDGRHVMISDYSSGYELTLPDGSQNFDDIWHQPPVPVDLGKRDVGEGVGYNVDGTAVFVTSEGENEPLIEVERRK